MNNLSSLLDIYESLTKSQRALFKALQWFTRKFHSVYCSIEKLVQFIRYHRATIFRGLKVLCDLGWLAIKNQGHHKTNLYFLNKELISIDFEKELRQRNLRHEKQNATSVRPNINNHMNPIGTRSEKGTEKSENQPEYPSWLPYSLRIKTFRALDERYKRFIESIPGAAIVEAVNDCIWYAKQGNKIDDSKALLLSRLAQQKKNVTSCS